MKLRVSYEAKSVLHLLEHWPIRRDGYELTFQFKGNNVVGISVEFEIPIKDFPAVSEGSPKSAIAASISIPESGKLKEARSFVRRIQSFVDSMAPTLIDFDSETLEWLPETDKERENLRLFKFSVSSSGTRYDTPIELTFEFIAALSYHAYSATPQEIALSFVRKGHEDHNDKKYISAFYNYFFSLETQFFAGYSDPKKVKSALKKCLEVRSALVDLRDAIDTCRKRSPQEFDKFLEYSDDQILDYIVDVRGRLHHHSPRGPASWHPDEQDVYKEEAFMLKVLASSITNEFIIGSVYNVANGSEFFKQCEEVGAIVTVIGSGVAITSHGKTQEFELRMRIPSLTPHAALIESLNNRLRDHLWGMDYTPKRYTLKTENGDILASYEVL